MTKTWRIVLGSLLALLIFGIGIAVGDSRGNTTMPMMNVRRMGPMAGMTNAPMGNHSMMQGSTGTSMPMMNGTMNGMPGMSGSAGSGMKMGGMGGSAGMQMGHGMMGGMNGMSGMAGMGAMSNGMQMPMGTTTTTR